jgi:predicted DNA-binding transcriptional regulator AlpA
VGDTTRVPRLLRVRDVERLTGLEAWRVYELIARGEGPEHLRIGKTIRIPEDALVRWIREQTAEQRAQEPAQ